MMSILDSKDSKYSYCKIELNYNKTINIFGVFLKNF